MASTYSTNLKIELIGTGEQAGTWGTTTNSNLGTALEQAIVGKADVTMSSTTITLTLTNSNAAQDARAIYLNLTGSPGGAAVLEVPAVEKPYIVKNGSDQVVTVKVTGQTGVAVPVGKTMWLYNNGTDVTNAIDNLPSGTTVGGSTIGDVTGPASATDNAVARFNGTTGKIIQNSTGVTIADDGTTVISVNSSSDALRITQTGTGNALVVEDAANPDATPFVVNAEGQVCVGAAAPVRALKFTVAGTSDTNDGGGINIRRHVDSASAPNIIFDKSRGTFTSPTIVSNGDILADIRSDGFDGTAYKTAGQILMQVDGTPGTDDMPGRLVFSTTADGASTPTEAMRITNARNVLVGGTAVRGTTVGTAHIDLFNGTAPAGTLTNGVSLYSSSGDFNFIDAAGGAYKVGYRNVPAVGTKTASYELQTADVGKYVQIGSGGSITIPDATFSEGDVVSLFNNTDGDITVTCTITTAYIAGTDEDKATVTLATRGVATILFISGTVCVIGGNVS
jgi:hypothetical protein